MASVKKGKTPQEFASQYLSFLVSVAMPRTVTSADLARIYSRLHDGWYLSGEHSHNRSHVRLLTFLFHHQAVAKTSAAPIERIKLLVQNQDEMVGGMLGLCCCALY